MLDGLVWDRGAAKVARSMSLADEGAWLSQIDAYVGSVGGSEWAGGDIDSDDDFCFPDEGGSGDDYMVPATTCTCSRRHFGVSIAIQYLFSSKLHVVGFSSLFVCWNTKCIHVVSTRRTILLLYYIY